MTDKDHYDWNTGNQFCMNLAQNIPVFPLNSPSGLVKTFEIDPLAMNEIPLVVVFHHPNNMKTSVYNALD